MDIQSVLTFLLSLWSPRAFFLSNAACFLLLKVSKCHFIIFLVCDAVFVTFVEKKRQTNCWNLWMQRLRKIHFLSSRLFLCFWFFIFMMKDLKCAQPFMMKRMQENFEINSSLFLKKKGLGYKNFLNYFTYYKETFFIISSAFYVWEFFSGKGNLLGENLCLRKVSKKRFLLHKISTWFAEYKNKKHVSR